MRLKFISPTMILLAVVICVTTARASMPQNIGYQGYLRNTDGTPVNTPVNVAFKLYSSTSGVNPVWSGAPQNVTPVAGVYSLQIGPISLPFDRQYWLGLTVGNDGEMWPLQPLNSVPYALKAATAEKASVLDLACPQHSVLVYRNGWECGAVTAFPNAAGTCVQGTCGLTSCIQGYGRNCDGTAATGAKPT